MAQYRLGKMIYEGGYYRRVPENAAYWLTLSAKQKNPYAEMLLGQLYILGDFLRLDRKAGVDLLYDAIYATGTLTPPIRSASITPTASA